MSILHKNVSGLENSIFCHFLIVKIGEKLNFQHLTPINNILFRCL